MKTFNRCRHCELDVLFFDDFHQQEQQQEQQELKCSTLLNEAATGTGNFGTAIGNFVRNSLFHSKSTIFSCNSGISTSKTLATSSTNKIDGLSFGNSGSAPPNKEKIKCHSIFLIFLSIFIQLIKLIV